jgi:hypothetical protein
MRELLLLSKQSTLYSSASVCYEDISPGRKEGYSPESRAGHCGDIVLSKVIGLALDLRRFMGNVRYKTETSM